MNTLAIGTFGNQTEYTPGATLTGKALWVLEKEAKSVEIRLFWYTQGKGSQDVEIMDCKIIPSPGLRGESEFSFQLPDSPHSFSGRLISLTWALEVIALPAQASARFDIVMAPGGKEILLHPDNNLTRKATPAG